jgi:hypothetical protein
MSIDYLSRVAEEREGALAVYASGDKSTLEG